MESGSRHRLDAAPLADPTSVSSQHPKHRRTAVTALALGLIAALGWAYVGLMAEGNRVAVHVDNSKAELRVVSSLSATALDRAGPAGPSTGR